MSKKLFTTQQQNELQKNPYVKRVSDKAITYTDAFKEHFIQAYEQGKLPHEIFQGAGFDVDILGTKRIQAASDRWRTAYEQKGIIGLADARKYTSGRPSTRELSPEEQITRLEAKLEWLEVENEFLKKLGMARKAGEETKIQVSARQKFEWIQQITNCPKFKRKVRWLCHLAQVSRSGYYAYLSEKAVFNRQKQQEQDEQAYQILLSAYRYKGRKKGARQIHMTLQLQYGFTYNLKRIRRLMKKFGLMCPIRRANPMRRMAKATQEHRTCPNTLQREFKPGVAGQVLLTDITYLRYGASRRAYLSTIKDAQTNEILAYKVSESLGLDLALDTLKQLKKYSHLTPTAFIHSDQGFHYTHPKFQKLVKQMKLGQSMSRRGNCWDNAPQESFFGHLKDETDLKACQTLQQVKQEVNRYMTYYNLERGQWNLKKLPPATYRQQLLHVS
ncbi:IS3 family transposase [Paenibacillus lemnae]|uniref:IS3 family transposase n=1 Tax=Paenibacillus lemnae TaxID=1330551 RepID=A0A848M5B5_PAELE|nr:IS3 family transposase [Paenibacillus lemnae]NMO96308.1 IS3 family transposase [Paenibacillus lemnae]